MKYDSFSPGSMTLSRRTRRVLLGLVVVPLLSAAGLEIGCRLIDRWRGKPWDAQQSRASVEQLCRMLTRISYDPEKAETPAEAERLSRTSILNPYTGWEERLTQDHIADDQAYYGRPESKQNFDVLILGGSVAYFFGDLGGPRLLERIAAATGRARRMRVHNYAIGGYKQPQHTMLLSYLLAVGHEPDAVIALDGFNEAALGWDNSQSGTHPIYPPLHHWISATNSLGTDAETVEMLFAVRAAQDRAREFGEWFLRSGLWRSCFLDHALELRLERLRRRYARAFEDMTNRVVERPKEAETRGPRYESEAAAIVGSIRTAWEEGSASMSGMCASRGIPYLHVLQPTLHDRGSKPLTDLEVAKAFAIPTWIEGVKQVYPSLREGGARLSARGVPFLDASLLFQDHPEDLYYDACHFGERGNEILADAVADRLVPMLAR